QVVDVDEVLGVRQPQLHHRQQAVAAGDQPGLVTEPGQQPDGVLDAGRTLVLDRRRHLHGGEATSTDVIAEVSGAPIAAPSDESPARPGSNPAWLAGPARWRYDVRWR